MTVTLHETQRSRELFDRARTLIPGGVNSPVRAFRAVGGEPRFIARARGARMWDEDGNEFIDFVGSWGPMILGHAHPDVAAAIAEQASRGTSFGAPGRLEVVMAETLPRFVPSLEMSRMVNSGTEATMAAARLARGFTGRAKIVKFEGCYHGHGDSFLIKAGSGAATFGQPDSPGVTEGTARDTLIARFNSLDSVRGLFKENPGAIAAVIVEPVVGNMGVVRPRAGFLEGLRAITSAEGALLIFDEVMTGFRLARGGAQEVYRITPDLTTLGKIIGGGLPVGAYGGRRDIMSLVAPAGPVYQAGTLSGNPVAMAAGLATLRAIDADPRFYDTIEGRGRMLEEGIVASIAKGCWPVHLSRAGSMWTLFFTRAEPADWPGASASDTARFGKWFGAMLSRGIYLAPSQYEANFISAAHTDADIDATIRACAESMEAAFA